MKLLATVGMGCSLAHRAKSEYRLA